MDGLDQRKKSVIKIGRDIFYLNDLPHDGKLLKKRIPNAINELNPLYTIRKVDDEFNIRAKNCVEVEDHYVEM